MAQQNIDFGSFPDDPSADAIRTAFSKVQNNFNQLFGANANSAVTSINRTPGAGITVNYPTGNVILSANIACLQVATTSLRVGRGSDNTQTNVTITSSTQALNIDIDPSQVLSNYFGDVENGLTRLNGTLTANANAQPNVTSLGTLSNLSVSGNVSFTGPNVYISNVSNFRLLGGTLGYFLQTDGAGNLAWAAAGGGGNGSPGGINSYVQFNDTGTFGGNTGFTFNKVSGVLTSPFYAGDANGLANIQGPNVVGNVPVSDLSTFATTANAVAGANVSGTVANATYALSAGTVTTADQPNITGVGVLTSLTVAANGDITLSGVGSNIQGANIVSASYLEGTLTTAAQPNITSVGNLTSVVVAGDANISNLNVSGNAVITGNLSVLGNITSINVNNLNVEDPIISLGGGANGAPLTTNDGKDRGTSLQYYTTAPVTAFMGWDNGNAEFAMGSNVSISAGEIVTYNELGNVRVSTVLGNIVGSQANFANANLGNTATANYFVGTFYGTANTATTAGTVTTAAQPNITSVGTLSSLSVTGNVTAGNIVGTLANGNSNIRIFADNSVTVSSTGNANILVVNGTGANIAGTGNFTGNVTVGNLYGPLANGNSNVSIAAANGNITMTAVGNTVVTVTGTGVNVAGTLNTNSGVITGNGSGLSSLVGANVTGTVANATYAVSAGSATTANSATTAGTVTTNAQPNITSVGTLSGLSVTATITGNISGAAVTAGTVTTAAQANITSVGTLTSLNSSGTITAPAFTANTGVFTGNGNGLSSLAGGNVTGQVGNALVSGTVYTAAQPNITSTGTLTSVTSSGNISGANIIATSYHIRSVATGISAAGSTQGTATALTKEINVVSIVSSGAGVVLPTAVAGMVVNITNTSANSLLVYPASSGTINSLSVNAAFTQSAGATLQFIAPTSTQWYTVGATYA